VCGEPVIDVALLQRHTIYSGVAPSAPHIQYFWEALRSFEQADLHRFIRFAWAQDRLPADDAEFEQTHTRMMIKHRDYPKPDAALPRADTCFFNVELPAYSSVDVMRQRLLYAITSCVGMNRDNPPAQ
jgi:other hect domain ubiquitin protein ligase E3